MSTLHLVYTSDENYLFPTKVSIVSALAFSSRPKDLVFHVLDCGISDTSWQTFSTGFNIVRHKVNLEQLSSFHAWKGSLATYARLLTPELLQTEKWCVFVDGDTLFTDDPFILEAYYRPELSILGHKDLCIQPIHHKWYAKNNIPFDENKYICMGFFIMNLQLMRKNGATAEFLSFLSRYSGAPFVDQEALNTVCLDSKAFLPDPWGDWSVNAFGKATRPGCVHYVGEFPCKLDYSLKTGYSDAVSVWLKAAQGLLGVSRKEAMGIAWWKWTLGRTHNKLVGIIGKLFYPLFPRIFPNFKTHFIDTRWRFFAKQSFWLELRAKLQ